MGRQSVELSIGTLLCPYPIAYRRAYGLSFRWTAFKEPSKSAVWFHTRPFVGVFKSQFRQIFHEMWAVLANVDTNWETAPRTVTGYPHEGPFMDSEVCLLLDLSILESPIFHFWWLVVRGVTSAASHPHNLPPSHPQSLTPSRGVPS